MPSPPFQPLPPKREVTDNIIKQAFNEGQFWQRAQSGDLQASLVKDDHPRSLPKGHPLCTKSQFLVYHKPDGEPVAWVHQYLLPNGRLGGSGRPDPKALVVEGLIMFVRSRR